MPQPNYPPGFDPLIKANLLANHSLHIRPINPDVPFLSLIKVLLEAIPSIEKGPRTKARILHADYSIEEKSNSSKDWALRIHLAEPSAEILTVLIPTTAKTIWGPTSYENDRSQQADLRELIADIEAANTWAGPADASEIRSALSWFDSFTAAMSDVSQAASYCAPATARDFCSRYATAPACCAAHTAVATLCSHVSDAADLYDSRPFGQGTQGEPEFPSGSKYPFLWWDHSIKPSVHRTIRSLKSARDLRSHLDNLKAGCPKSFLEDFPSDVLEDMSSSSITANLKIRVNQEVNLTP